MDIATLIGTIGGFALIIISIMIGSPISAFVNIPGLLIVVGGTFMATLIMQRFSVVFRAMAIAKNAFFDKSEQPQTIISHIVSLAGKARQGGVLALEKEDIKNPYLARGVRMAVDGVALQEIRNTLKIEIESMIKRHETGQKVFKFMGATAPAMGMIGTLIGLIQMLRGLNDPSSVGPAMAVALLTTFYGAILAFLIFNPIAEKLEDRTIHEGIVMEIILTGIEGISQGMNKAILEDKLISFLSPGMRQKK